MTVNAMHSRVPPHLQVASYILNLKTCHAVVSGDELICQIAGFGVSRTDISRSVARRIIGYLLNDYL